MLIQNTSPVIVPSSEEVVFDSLWISRVIIDTPNAKSDGRAIIEVLPYNADKKEVLNQPRHFRIENLWHKIEETPEFSEAMAKIIQVVQVLESENQAS
jgi:hypothetical protein